MSGNKKELLDGLLKGLNESGGIEGSAVVSRDGLLVSSLLSNNVDIETFAAMSATMVGAAETAVNELRKGSMERVIVESGQSKIVALGAGPSALLVVMAGPKANLGLVLVEMKKASEKIAQALG